MASGVNPTRQQLRALARENALWPAQLVEVPRDMWPCAHESKGFVGYFRSRTFLVQVFKEGGGIIRLSVNRTDWDVKAGSYRAGITWDELQRLKAEAGYGECMAVEIYPEDSNVVNVANIRHLWVLPERLPFGWRNKKEANDG